MVANEALRINLARNDALLTLYPARPLLSNTSVDWGGLYLQYHRQPPPEMVEHSCSQHRLIINDRTLRSPVVESFEGKISSIQ